MKEIARLNFAHLPTPMEELPRLSEKLGGPRILVKRDDQTGLAFGGNKTRKLEFLVVGGPGTRCKDVDFRRRFAIQSLSPDRRGRGAFWF